MSRRKTNRADIEENHDPQQEKVDRDEECPTCETPDDEVTDAADNDQIPVQEELSEEEKLRSRVVELEDKLLRSAAEFDNYKKRLIRQYDDVIRVANDGIFQELLHVIDSFERARQHDNEHDDTAAFRDGVEMIYQQLTGLLGRFNIEPIEAVGRPFDPGLHEAMMQVGSDEFAEDVIAIEINKGYRQGDRVLRHSKVGVSKGKVMNSPEESDEKDDSGDN
ncbi:MAG: nucleotide exchange factor GrpE [bacterium]